MCACRSNCHKHVVAHRWAGHLNMSPEVTGCEKKQPIIAYGPVSIAKLDHCPWWSSRSDEWNKRAASVYIIYGGFLQYGYPNALAFPLKITK